MNRFRTWCRLTPRWNARVEDKMPSSNVSARAAQLNRQVSRMRHFKFPVVLIFLSLCAANADAEPVSQSATFRELFGVEQADSIATLGADTARCLADALEDFNLVLADKDPIHSKSGDFSIAADGGNRSWRHPCYELTVLKSLTSLQQADGTWIHGYIEGPSLMLKLGPKGWQPSPIARTRLSFLQRVTPNTSLERTRER